MMTIPTTRSVAITYKGSDGARHHATVLGHADWSDGRYYKLERPYDVLVVRLTVDDDPRTADGAPFDPENQIREVSR